MKHAAEYIVLHSLTLEDLRTCELALSMLIKKRDLLGPEAITRLHATLDRLSDARCLCQAEAGQTYVRGDETLHDVHLPLPGRPT